MIIKKSTNNNHVKFISYDGKYPCLCMGTLILQIDGINYSFGDEGHFIKFWESGGTCGFTDDWDENVTKGEWIINIEEIPKQFRKYSNEIDEVFNNNVRYGCCGGCL